MSDPSGVWALGDFPRVSRETIGATGPELVAVCGIGPGQRVLDVGAGAGNVAIPAARTGATVVASDITPALLTAGRRIAEAAGVTLDWVHADAQALPFADGAFDVVTSVFGVMFAPDHQAAAHELLRVCAPGGTIGLMNWTPDGWTGRFFGLLAPFQPAPPPGFQPPTLWGDEGHVRTLLGDGASLELERRVVVLDHFDTPAALVSFYRENFGPVIVTYAGIADDPARVAALDQTLLDFAERTNLAPARKGGACFELEYLLVKARVARKG